MQLVLVAVPVGPAREDLAAELADDAAVVADEVLQELVLLALVAVALVGLAEERRVVGEEVDAGADLDGLLGDVFGERRGDYEGLLLDELDGYCGGEVRLVLVVFVIDGGFVWK